MHTVNNESMKVWWDQSLEIQANCAILDPHLSELWREYIGGGVVSNKSGAPDIIQVIDPTAQHVSQLPPCPVKNFGLVCIDNQIVTVGGKTILDEQVTNRLHCWNEATQQWEQILPPMSTPRYFHTSMVWNNYLIVCGGRTDNEDSITDSVEILNLQSKHWHNASSLPLQESGKRAIVTDSGKLQLLVGWVIGQSCALCKLANCQYCRSYSIMEMQTSMEEMCKHSDY